MSSTVRAAGAYAQESLPAPSRHIEITKSRLEHTTPVQYDPASLKPTGVTASSSQLTGTVLTVDGAVAIVDVTPGSIYRHNIRNVVTYSGAAENTFAQVKEGNAVYYDRSSTMPANCYLSLSKLDKDGVANPFFGYVVLGFGESDADFPKGTTSASTVGAAVLQASMVGAQGPTGPQGPSG